jgi:hypothetical protein
MMCNVAQRQWHGTEHRVGYLTKKQCKLECEVHDEASSEYMTSGCFDVEARCHCRNVRLFPFHVDDMDIPEVAMV